jgi:hypothetical protein
MGWKRYGRATCRTVRGTQKESGRISPAASFTASGDSDCDCEMQDKMKPLARRTVPSQPRSPGKRQLVNLAAGEGFERPRIRNGYSAAVLRNQVAVLEGAQRAGDRLARGADELANFFVRH